MTVSPRHSVSVAAAVVRADGRILAIRRRDNGRWEPPGGILDLGETIDEGLRREVSEETGLLVERDNLTGVYKNVTHGIIALVFRCRAISGTPHPTAEASEVAWLTPDEVRKRMSPAFAIRLLDAVEDQARGPAVRTHDGQDLLADTKPRS